MLCTGSARNNSTFVFFRELGNDGGNAWKGVNLKVHGARRIGSGAANTRRIFGGTIAEMSAFPATCALLDRYFAARCSAAVLAPHWVLTAAHCVSSTISYIKYNTRLTSSDQGDVVAVHYLYRHPEYRVLQEDVGNGMDVTLLHHDVGLIRTRDEIKLSIALPPDPLARVRRYDPMNLIHEEVLVLGFGRTESTALGEELCGARLRLVACGRSAWYHVVCGMGNGGSGVCAGDSGGPVIFAGVQLAVTSMGPRECAHLATPALDAVSVFTALRPYVDILNATMAETDKAMRMRMIASASRTPTSPIINLTFGLLWNVLFARNRHRMFDM
ncbi:unnamed protein product, partial [Iphiclides podalirius]